MPDGWLDSLVEWSKDPCDTDSPTVSTFCRTVGLVNPVTSPVLVVAEGSKLLLRNDTSSLEDFRDSVVTAQTGLETVLGGVGSLFGGGGEPTPAPKPPGFGDLVLPLVVLGGAVAAFVFLT